MNQGLKISFRTQVTRQAALTAEKEATDTESQYQQANAAMATYKASQTAWKACQAAEAAGEAEAFANEAASHARNARTAAALTHALGAAQAYNEVPPSPPSNCPSVCMYSHERLSPKIIWMQLEPHSPAVVHDIQTCHVHVESFIKSHLS